MSIERTLSVTDDLLLSVAGFFLSWIRNMLDERFDAARADAFYGACALKAWHNEACQRAIFEMAHSKIWFSDLGRQHKGENDNGK